MCVCIWVAVLFKHLFQTTDKNYLMIFLSFFFPSILHKYELRLKCLNIHTFIYIYIYILYIYIDIYII